MGKKVTKLGLSGAAGRMGKEIIRQIADRPTTNIVAAVEQRDSPFLGFDCGELSGIGASGVKITGSLESLLPEAEVLIDFSIPKSTMESIRFCSAHKLPLVIGTTGMTGHLDFVRQSSKKVPIVMAPNMSVGVNLSFKIVELAARILGTDFDTEIIEAHHRNKLDSPSGTAIRLGEIVAKEKGVDFQKSAIYGREGHTGVRQSGTIGFGTIRAGDIVGDHTVLFAGNGERIEITHRASDRSAFASGAILAAEWLVGKDEGLFDMQDVLGLR